MTVSREAKKEIEARLSGLKRPVDLSVFTQDFEGPACRDSRALAELLAEITQKVAVESADFVADGALVRKYGVRLLPALVVSSREGKAVRLYGTPTGYGVWTLIDAVRAASVEPELAPETVEWLSGLDREISLTVVAGTTSPVCPAVAGMVLKMGLASAMVSANVLYVEGFPHLAVRWGVSELPTVLAGDSKIVEGVVTEKDLVQRLKALSGR